MPPTNTPTSFHPNKVTSTPNKRASAPSNLMTILVCWILVITAGLLPIAFLPGETILLGLAKTTIIQVALALVLIIGSFLALKEKEIRAVTPFALGFFWLFVLFTFISAYISEDLNDTLRGSFLGTTTAVFTLLLGLALTLPMILQNSKRLYLYAIGIFGLSSITVLLYGVSRIIFGAEFLSFGIFTSVGITPIGGINDLAILAAITLFTVIVSSLIIPLKNFMQTVLIGVSILSLFVLAIANFYIVWVIVAILSSVVLAYLLALKHLFTDKPTDQSTNKSGIPVSATVTMVVIAIVGWGFVLANDTFSRAINEIAPVDYLEVRPSPEGTLTVAKGVFENNLLFGVGPNRFSDAWIKYKDPLVNTTIYWDTDFNAGYGYVPTVFITNGVIAGSMLVLMHVFLLVLGFRMFVKNTQQSSIWYQLGLLSFTISVFVWGISYVYVPSVSILLIGAFFTGLTFAAATPLLPHRIKIFTMTESQQRGFVFMVAFLLIISFSFISTLSTVRQYMAQQLYLSALAALDEPETASTLLSRASQNFRDQRFESLRTQIEIVKLRSMLAISNPTPEDQKRFVDVAQDALYFAEETIKLDRTDPDTHALMGSIYNIMAMAGGEGAFKRAEESLKTAQELDPLNPGYNLLFAEMAVRNNDLDRAKNEAAAAIALKPNFTQALFLSAQISIREGNTEAALDTTQEILSFEPRNPTRHFQLGVLHSALGQSKEAQVSFQTAVALDPYYANARYLLALELIAQNENERALEQLNKVRETNGDNAELVTLIGKLEAGETIELPDTSAALNVPVFDPQPTESISEEQLPVEVNDYISPVNPTISEIQPEIDDIPSAESEPTLNETTTDETEQLNTTTTENE